MNDFIPKNNRTTLSYSFKGNPSIKHVIEALGAPHPEVGLILVNNLVVDFDYPVQDGDEVHVYPVSHSTDSLSEELAQKYLNGEPRFILDNHLGKLATYLRMLGFDVKYRNDLQDEELAQTAYEEDRILLTRDQDLLKRKVIDRGYWIRDKDPDKQLREVLRHFDLYRRIEPFRRCLRCNGNLVPVRKEEVLDRLEPKTKLYYHDFRVCVDCDQVYWKGSHFRRMQKFIEKLL